MISLQEIEKLAALCRVALAPGEKQSLRQDMDAVLNYVGEVQKVSAGLVLEKKAGSVRNVMRQDGEPHQSGAFTEVLLTAAPKKEGQYIKVKKIL